VKPSPSGGGAVTSPGDAAPPDRATASGNDAASDTAPPPPPPLVLPVGHSALLVELPTADAAEAFHAEVLRRREAGAFPAVGEIVPGARTVLLDGLADPRRLAAELPGWRVPPLTRNAESAVRVPIRYDGPDLADVAEMWGVEAEEVARLHSETVFRVAFCGFAPGFSYLTGLPDHCHVPRRADPRTKVPAGSVGLAGTYTGVYPRSSPGGWQLIGTAVEIVLWDPEREPAALLTPGTQVRFVRQDAP
jgi:KipI family sensor histidine kinase inhibitor